MELSLFKMEAKEKMVKAIEQYKTNLNKISAGRANPKVLDSIKIDYFETLTPINQISSISVPDPRQLLIKPFDQSITKDIVNAINSASIGLNASDEGHQARITLPELTQQRRQQLVKQTSEFTEQAKIGIRSSRQDTNKLIKSDEELSEDEVHSYLDAIQNLTNDFIKEVDTISKEKEKELLTI